jgi:hypothetical protein
MKYWRMRMRKGWHGFDMFRKCRAEGVAAIHYTPVEDVNLTNFSEDDLPPQWSGLEPAQKGSLRKVAWRIRGGDVIYVAESNPSRIVCVGRVKGPDGSRAYHYVANTPIADDDKHPWRHQIDVEWGELLDVPYPAPHATQNTVLELKPPEVARIKNLIRGSVKENSVSNPRPEGRPSAKGDETEEEIHLRQLEESAYTRYTAESIRKIDRRHVKLCNDFTNWLISNHGIKCNVERRNIDVTFRLGKQSALVEFKIAYNGDPKPAIREALGQILEYNHYPDRVTYDQWVLILDCKPTEADGTFLKTLRKYRIPLSYGWQTEVGFEFSQESPLFSRNE